MGNGTGLACAVALSGALMSGAMDAASAEWRRTRIGGGSARRYLADIDGDGRVDSISATHWFKNPGDGTGNWQSYSIGNKDYTALSTDSVRVGDVNGDGRADLVIGVGRRYPRPDRNRIYAFINPRGRGTWHRYLIGELPDAPDGVETVAIADMNNDGHPDILAGGECARLVWFVNPGVMRDKWRSHVLCYFRFYASRLAWGTTDVEGTAIADFNNDKYPDVAVVTCSPHGAYGGLYVLLNPKTRTGNWKPIQLENLTSWAAKRSCIGSIAAADIDQDGKADIVLANSQPLHKTKLYWYRNNGTSPWKRHTIDTLTDAHLRAGHPEVADVDLDGKPDVICYRRASSALYWYRNPGRHGTWSRARICGRNLQFMGIGDVDRDGDPDIIGAGNWYRNPAR